MNGDFCSSILCGLSGVHMSDSERARAADRVRKSVALVEWVLALATPRRRAVPAGHESEPG